MRKDCGTCHFEKKLLEEEPCNHCDDNYSEWKSGKIYFAIAELEKIKADIDEIVEREMKGDMRWSLGLRHSKKIIDNHIKELKGENNGNS